MERSTERTVANMYKDTRDLLNEFKEKYQFKSDDQAIRFLCQSFGADQAKILDTYLRVKNGE